MQKNIFHKTSDIQEESTQNLLGVCKKALDLPPPSACGPVAVAMSGGVDSSTIAAVLKHLGYTVIGMTLRLYTPSKTSEESPKSGTCCAGRDILDAKAVAHRMGFSHYVLDYEEKFRRGVMNPFVESYAKGETPIPCVLCNQTVKFSDLLKQAKDLGCCALVTGHYVQRIRQGKHVYLHRGVDPVRDQSYFMFATKKNELLDARFPLGGLLKTQTRKLAAHFQLNVAKKKESQDICFVGGGKYTDVLKKLDPNSFKPGPLVNLSGDVLGVHKGIAAYTVGQRRGIGIASKDPLFVVKIEPAHNRVVVGPRSALLTKALYIRDINWLWHDDAVLPNTLHVRLRSSGVLLKARIALDPQSKTAFVLLCEGQSGIAKGQACVFYNENCVLGGGTILETVPCLESMAPHKDINRENILWTKTSTKKRTEPKMPAHKIDGSKTTGADISLAS